MRSGALLELLRWHKPSGRLILLIPAGWALWLNPAAPPEPILVGWIVLGGLAVSGAGCIANDLWDRRIDPLVERTRNRPLAAGRVGVEVALALLLLCLLLALLVVLALPPQGRGLCLLLAIAALPPILLYPSAKRWFALPQLVLALCWGFAVLIPWAAASGSLVGGPPFWAWPLGLTWLATLLWTFGFDTVYAMADREDDRALGVRSSALTLAAAAPLAVAVCYGLSCAALALAVLFTGRLAGGNGLADLRFWLPWLLACLGMQREAALLRRPDLPRSAYGRHFSRQVWLGSLLLLALILAAAI
jgi:4-hydroxybenzoate polyprenyltransferase